MNEHRQEFALELMCRVLKVARAGIYQCLNESKSCLERRRKRLQSLLVSAMKHDFTTNIVRWLDALNTFSTICAVSVCLLAGLPPQFAPLSMSSRTPRPCRKIPRIPIPSSLHGSVSACAVACVIASPRFSGAQKAGTRICRWPGWSAAQSRLAQWFPTQVASSRNALDRRAVWPLCANAAEKMD